MPYMSCPECNLTTYAVAREQCPRCATPLLVDDRERRLHLLTQTARELRRERAAKRPADRLEQRLHSVAETLAARAEELRRTDAVA